MKIEITREPPPPAPLPPITSVTLTLTPEEWHDLQAIARCGFERIYGAMGNVSGGHYNLYGLLRSIETAEPGATGTDQN